MILLAAAWRFQARGESSLPLVVRPERRGAAAVRLRAGATRLRSTRRRSARHDRAPPPPRAILPRLGRDRDLRPPKGRASATIRARRRSRDTQRGLHAAEPGLCRPAPTRRGPSRGTPSLAPPGTGTP